MRVAAKRGKLAVSSENLKCRIHGMVLTEDFSS